MKYFFANLCLAIAVCVSTSPAPAQDAQPTRPSTDPIAKAIQASSARFVKAFNAGEAKAVAALWTAGGDYVDENGETSRGREEIERKYAAFFKSHAGSTIEVRIDSIRKINPHTVIEDGVAQLDSLAGSQMTRSRYTAVHTLADGKWLMSSVRDVSLATPGNHARLKGLVWLLGTWQAEHQGTQLEMTFRWLPNKSFIQRDFKVTKADRVVLSGKQIIGWDPLEERVSSWLFDSTGSYSVGTWTPHESGWVVRATGVTSDGMWTRATNVFSQLHDRLVWKSIRRGAGNFDLLDSDEILLKRKK